MPGHDAAENTPHPARAPSIANGWLYMPGFLSEEAGAELLRWCLDHVRWHREPIRLFGRTHVAPRLVGWCGDPGLSYRYAGQDHPGHGWPMPLQRIRERLAQETDISFNFLLLNRYRCGSDRMGWHRDDEPMTSRMVASISLGAQRRFLMRQEPDRPSVRLTLEHGSLLLMDRFVPHALPATRRPIGERVNLSFRSLPCPI